MMTLPIAENDIECLADTCRDLVAVSLQEMAGSNRTAFRLEPHEESALHFVLSATLERFLRAVARNRRHRS